ncbi:MAG TPA: hypothetical protein VN522_13515 [Solirubrobacterales bacterium]|nr:hypothetical protein [Solirubrobacterales bacterium]
MATLALVVGAVLALLSAAASGVETLPENTVAPTISPSTPIEGKTETATQGTWNGSPTAYSYAWYRCTGTESCVSIPSATSSTYVPTAIDLTKTLRVSVTASNTVGSASAISSATSIVKFPPAPYYWSSCKKTGTGIYTNATCSVVGAGGFEWSKIAAATPTAFTAASSTTFTMELVIFGTPVVIGCTSQSSEGTLENPSEAKTGVVSSSSFKLTGCAMSKPAECKLTSTSQTFETIRGSAVEGGDGAAVKFEPVGSSFFKLKVINCPLEGTYTIVGSFAGIFNPTSSSLEFTKASSAGHSVILEGTTKLQTTAGESLKLAP